jgi:hypothetical protein
MKTMRKDDAMRTHPLFVAASVPATPVCADARLHFLNVEHDDLDAAIAALAVSGNADDLIITRLKKRKLRIKDEIAALLSVAVGAEVAKAS